MKKKSTSALVILFLLSLGFSACTKDDVALACNFEGELEAYEDKIKAFLSNPTAINCGVLREASFTLLDQAEGCPAADREAIMEITSLGKDLSCKALDGRE